MEILRPWEFGHLSVLGEEKGREREREMEMEEGVLFMVDSVRKRG